MSRHEWPAGTEALLDDILVDSFGDDEQLGALHEAIEDAVPLPVDAFVVGEPVSVIGFDYDGNSRVGLTAMCRRRDGSEHTTAAWEVGFAEGTEAAGYIAAYRMWLGLEPASVAGPPPTHRPRRHKVDDNEIDLDGPVELVVLALRENAARCRLLSSRREITLRSADAWRMVPGEIVTVRAKKQWRYAGHPYLSGDIEGHRIDAPALGLVPLELLDEWTWDPEDEYWGEEGDPLDDWELRIIACGPRPSFEMEQVLPGADPDDYESDPIVEAAELRRAGDSAGAEEILTKMLLADLRCLDAHAHLGNMMFNARPEIAIRHYEVGVQIGELSLGDDFDGLLPWGRVDNRPFLRCLHGFGLCLWRLDRDHETESVFERMLWLNPTDNQGVRFLLPVLRAGDRWDDRDPDSSSNEKLTPGPPHR
jgi:hypothetical protein